MRRERREGIIKIESIKHDGTFHRSWAENLILYEVDVLIGGNYKTTVIESSGEIWTSHPLALFYFSKTDWFNVIILMESREQYSYYCNLASPYTMNDGVLQYIDYDIDVTITKDGKVNILDEDEFEENGRRMNYSTELKQTIYEQLAILKKRIAHGQAPFNEDFVQSWYDRYIEKIK